MKHETGGGPRSSSLGVRLAAVAIGALGPGSARPAADLALPTGTQVGARSDEVPAGLGAADWSGIRDAYDESRDAVRPAAGGWRARNHGQQWWACFDGRGFTTLPDAGAWTWGLQLERYGFGDEEPGVDHPTRTSAADRRVAYDWGETLTEWYVNDAHGLEHGFTVHRRPPRHGCRAGDEVRDPLTITLAVRGELLPEVQDGGRDVRFLDERGAAAIAYTGLAVLDADGRALPARFECAPGGLRLFIDERGARYPLTVDPIVQQAYLKASNTDAFDKFGLGVAVSGDTVVVGAPFESSNATGVNGDQSDNSAPAAGAAYVFVRSGTTWSQQAYLKASNTDADDFFGRSLSIWGDTIVVGAQQEDSGATGTNGVESDNSAPDAGAAYVFVREGTSWSQQAYLKASNTDPADRFGNAVAICGDTIVVGAKYEDSNATTVNGDQADNSSARAGATYVFVRSGTTWTQQAYLKASNNDPEDFFGCDVSVSGDTAAVSAYAEDSSAIGVNGDESDNSASGSGAAYVFVRSGTAWSQQAYLKASNTESHDLFGYTVSNSGDTVLVGAEDESSGGNGVNGKQNNNLALYSGAAYVFVRSGATWSQQAYLKASHSGKGDAFSSGVSISGDTAVVGAGGESSNSTGVNGDELNNLAPQTGAAYLFVRNGAVWTQKAYLKASNQGGRFGTAVAVEGDTVVVGAEDEPSNATGVNGDQTNTSADYAGAAYVFASLLPTVYCTAGTSASGCTAAISAAGTPSATATSGFDLIVSTAEGRNGGASFYIGTNGRQAVPWGNGTSFQCVAPPLRRTGYLMGSGTPGHCDGYFVKDLNAQWCPTCPSPSLNPGAGVFVQAQLWYRDRLSTSNRTTSLSDAIEFCVDP